MEIMLIICILLLIIVIVANIFLILKVKNLGNNNSTEQLELMLKDYINQENRNTRVELNSIMSNLITTMSENITNNQSTLDTQRNSQLDSMDKSLENIRKTMYEQLEKFSEKNERKISEMRDTVEKQLEMIRSDNNSKLESMRETVNEKLQKTLDEKLSNSFSLVTQKLEQVYKELGEMQTLATGVGDLKKVLSNVKTRGILGEIQLGAILKEILSPEQYDENIITVSGTRNSVEFAVKLPNDNNSFIYLPIDSKFPADTYQHLLDAQDSGDKTAVEVAVKQLIATLKSEAKDIHEKYISPPQTTDFGIMFLPCEGLYAEAVNRGLVEILQKNYKINIAGPSTMAALLNSLQMGFKTLAVQKRSAEVWNILNSVKEEFDKFNDVLEATQNRINQANKELDKLVGVRTRQIQRSLSKITEKQELY